jgi:hypothetical protein
MPANDKLRERLALLKEIKCLETELRLNDDDMKSAADHLATLHLRSRCLITT